MTSKTKVPVPYGFALTADAYRLFLSENRLEKKIAEALSSLKDPNDTATLQKVGAEIRKMISSAPMPKELEREIVQGYEELGAHEKVKNPFVAIRSSATAEDLPDASFAGQQETFLNISDEHALIDACKSCFASLFTNRAITYREINKFNHFKVYLSIGVQKMVRSDLASSGVMFTLDTESGFKDVVFITG